MIWDIVIAVLVVVALVLDLWEAFSKLGIQRRIKLSAIRVICLTVAMTIGFFEILKYALLLQTSTLGAVSLCVLMVWFSMEVFHQTYLVNTKTRSFRNKWVD